MIPITVTVGKRAGSLTISPRDVKKFTYVNSVSLDGNQVQSDKAEIVIRQSPDSWRSDWNGVHQGCSVSIHGLIDGAYRNEKYFYKSLVRTGKNEFTLTLQSPVGRLLSKHPGGLYDGSQSLRNVIADVIGNVIVPAYNPALSDIQVYGWAPYQSRRKTLQDLMFAYGFIIRRDSNQNLYFTFPDSDSYAMPRNAIYIGGSVDYKTGNGYARADVTAKELFIDSGVEEKTLFDNVSGGLTADNLLVTFDSPTHSLSASGELEIRESGTNYAVVSGVGTLKGKPYSIIESVVSVDGDADADPENVLSVPNNAFITTLNAVSIAERLMGVRRAVSVSVNLRRTIQRAGDLVSFTDPFGDQQTGYIVSLNGEVTSIDKAAAEIICGYSPAWGNAYDAVTVLTPTDEAASNRWTVPPELDGKTLRVILIGGGAGGASGQHGSDNDASGNDISGGKKGTPGRGGKVREISLTVHVGETYEYHCGSGGAGGAPSADYDTDENQKKTYRNNAGNDGDATTFGLSESNPHSSADGAYSGMGFYDVIGDTRYATPGINYGVDGGEATTAEENDNRTSPGYTDIEYPTVTLPWDETQIWSAGGYGGGKWWSYPEDEYGPAYNTWAYGGLGGGAAVGSYGGDGNAAADYDTGGNGGKGADALPIFPTIIRAYGSGGSGGHGGGEGGTGGSGNTTESTGSGYNGRRGAGGSGSKGQDGAPGCVLIYYKSPG